MPGKSRLSDVQPEQPRFVWFLPGVTFDEARWMLEVDGRSVEIEQKPLELFLELLHRAGEVVTKAELFVAVWPGVTVVESSLPTAITKLRRALGTHADLIETVARLGYRIAGSVSVLRRASSGTPVTGMTCGQTVPRNQDWRLIRCFSRTGADDVWLAEHAGSGELRVFKFAYLPGRLRALKRETALARLLTHGASHRQYFIAPLEHDFGTIPAYAAFAYGGQALDVWLAGEGATADRAERIALIVSAARSLAVAHGLGVLHNDIKPANMLIAPDADAAPRIRLIDFGSGALSSRSRLDLVQLDGLTGTLPDEQQTSPSAARGSSGYLAPELLAGSAPTIASDIYALGVVAFKLIAGDMAVQLAPGWERLIPDPLLREDIATACSINPAERFSSADQLAERLQSLDRRRRTAEAEAERRIQLAELQHQRMRAEARQPWVRAAAAVLLLGTASTAAFAWQANRQRGVAVRQAAIASATSAFLVDDLLARSDPAEAEAADETITEAARRASADIDRRFGGAPIIAARLHHALARAFDQRSDLAAAREEYALAERAFAAAGVATERARVLLQWAQLEALSGDAARLPRSRELIAQAKATPAALDEVTAVWLASAEGSYALAAEDVPAAQVSFTQAAELAEQLPDAFDERQRLNLRQRVAFTYLRLGEGKRAQALLRPLAAAFDRLHGTDHPDSLNVRLNLVQAQLVAQQHEQVATAATALLPRMESRFGRDHRRTLQLLAVRQQALGSLGRYAEAARDGERVWRTTAAREGPVAFQAVAGRADTGETQCRAGDTQAGLANARAALEALRRTRQADTALAMAVRTTVAGCLVAAGRAAEAETLLRGIDRGKVAALVGDARWGANVDLLLGYVALARGDKVWARKLANRARRTFDTASLEPYRQTMLQRLEREASEQT